MKIKLNWFHSPETINWNRLWWFVGIGTTFWLGIATIVPEPWYKVVSVLLSAVQAAVTFAARGTKYVANRTDVPPVDGKI